MPLIGSGVEISANKRADIPHWVNDDGIQILRVRLEKTAAL